MKDSHYGNEEVRLRGSIELAVKQIKKQKRKRGERERKKLKDN